MDRARLGRGDRSGTRSGRTGPCRSGASPGQADRSAAQASRPVLRALVRWSDGSGGSDRCKPGGAHRSYRFRHRWSVLQGAGSHHFLPGVDIESAYKEDAVPIKHDEMISCISAPSIVATQLEQLGARPGHKVLEAGAATGYNALLLGKLVAPSGQVWTLDVDQGLVAGAQKNLAQAGATNVTAMLADGAAGLPEHAPYDRIQFTVGAGDVPAKILDQLAPGGRLVLPMRIRGSICRSFSFERDDDTWKTVSCEMATFIPLRKGVCDDIYTLVPMAGEGNVRLETFSEQDVDRDAICTVLGQPQTKIYTGVKFRAGSPWEWLYLYLACVLPNGLSRLPGARPGFTPLQIMALMERGLDQQARDTIDTTVPTEPWEHAIAALLRIHCRRVASPAPQPELDLALQGAAALIATPDPSTAAFQTRAGLTALDLAHDRTSPHTPQLQDAVANVAILDAYAARDVLNHSVTRAHLTTAQKQKLDAVLTASGLGTGHLSTTHMQNLTEAVDKAEVDLRGLLQPSRRRSADGPSGRHCVKRSPPPFAAHPPPTKHPHPKGRHRPTDCPMTNPV
ncbi:hypothetical protein [Streptomyces sp. ISID311]|uniref:hypothetical protein n=1 Tax=Streptomyces sp. ISID311 TaxID=2601673 RepID=UPI0021C3DC02|nr:hypothetical protein [Streptomyces sp. ISID311]